MATIETTNVVEEVVFGELSSGTKPWGALVLLTFVPLQISIIITPLKPSLSVLRRLLLRQLNDMQLGRTQVAAKQAPLARPLERWIVPC